MNLEKVKLLIKKLESLETMPPNINERENLEKYSDSLHELVGEVEQLDLDTLKVVKTLLEMSADSFVELKCLMN